MLHVVALTVNDLYNPSPSILTTLLNEVLTTSSVTNAGIVIVYTSEASATFETVTSVPFTDTFQSATLVAPVINVSNPLAYLALTVTVVSLSLGTAV